MRFKIRVVPYNPSLLIKYNAHINVEIVNSYSSIYCIYKYVYKGSDKISYKLKQIDENNMIDFTI